MLEFGAGSMLLLINSSFSASTKFENALWCGRRAEVMGWSRGRGRDLCHSEGCRARSSYRLSVLAT